MERGHFMKTRKTKEPQYQDQLVLRGTKGLATLGLMTNQVWHDDPRRFLFLLARYKFVSKMLSEKQRVLEIGCGDSFGTRIVLQEVGSICAIDFDPIFVKDVNERMEEKWKFECRVHDILSAPMGEFFDAAYSLDVIEHISERDEHRYMTNVMRSLNDDGIFLIGSPSIQSQIYASKPSREGHVNCKDAQGFKILFSKYL
jgi:SAM-dependent methyltransferase